MYSVGANRFSDMEAELCRIFAYDYAKGSLTLYKRGRTLIQLDYSDTSANE